MIETKTIQCSENPGYLPDDCPIYNYANTVVIIWRDKDIPVLKAWQAQVGITYLFERTDASTLKEWEGAADAAIERWKLTGKTDPEKET